MYLIPKEREKVSSNLYSTGKASSKALPKEVSIFSLFPPLWS